ncbi:MAG: MinD/ParA family ATP-binding protein, partial [Candidatus Dormibacteria bacterium]
SEGSIVVGVGQKKGGSGKTAAAAGAGVIAGIALVERGAKAVLIDGNINNPSGWGSLGFEEDEQTRNATVDRYVDALNNNEVPPKPTWAQTPGLAAYRENKRRSTGYSAGDVRLLRDSLAREYALIIVDLPNTLPMANNAPGEVVMHWLERVDVAVVPIDSDPSTIDDAHEFIDEIEKIVKRRGVEGRPVPVIISYLVPPSGELRQAPEFVAALEKLRERVEEIVEVPYDDKARLALWTRKSIPEVSPRLAQAYMRLTTAIARSAARARLQG